MLMTKDAVESVYHLKLELGDPVQSVKGHIVLELQKSKVTGEVTRVQRMQFSVEDGSVNHEKKRKKRIS